MPRRLQPFAGPTHRLLHISFTLMLESLNQRRNSLHLINRAQYNRCNASLCWSLLTSSSVIIEDSFQSLS